jgi:hypothetical protein
VNVIDLTTEREKRTPKGTIEVHTNEGHVVVELDPDMLEETDDGRWCLVLTPNNAGRFAALVEKTAAEAKAEGCCCDESLEVCDDT